MKSVKPTVFISMAPSPYPWSVGEYLQDWPTWSKYNWVDAIIPQCYRCKLEDYENVVKSQVSYLVNSKMVFGTGVLLNVGDYTANETFLTGMI